MHSCGTFMMLRRPCIQQSMRAVLQSVIMAERKETFKGPGHRHTLAMLVIGAKPTVHLVCSLHPVLSIDGIKASSHLWVQLIMKPKQCIPAINLLVPLPSPIPPVDLPPSFFKLNLLDLPVPGQISQSLKHTIRQIVHLLFYDNICGGWLCTGQPVQGKCP